MVLKFFLLFDLRDFDLKDDYCYGLFGFSNPPIDSSLNSTIFSLERFEGTALLEFFLDLEAAALIFRY